MPHHQGGQQFGFSVLLAFAAVVVAKAGGSAISPDQLVMEALQLRSPGGYNRAARPPPDNGSANLVLAHIYFNSLVAVNSAAQEISLLMWLTLSWTDSRLAWKCRLNSSLDTEGPVFIPARLLWLPDVFFYDLLQVQRVSDDNACTVQVSSSGAAMYSRQFVTTTKCSMDMFAFPYDAQSCHLLISSVIYPKRFLALHIGSYMENDSITTYLARSDEFCITGAEMIRLPNHYFDILRFVIYFKRRPTFYVLNLVLPSLLLLFISTLTFRLPPECGERISFSVTIVLSMCVFLQMVNEYTPTQSKSVPLLTCYCTLLVVMATTIVLFNAIVLGWWWRQSTNRHPVIANRLIRTLLLRSKPGAPRESPENSPSTADDVTSRYYGDVGNEWASAVAAADNWLFAIYLSVAVCIVVTLIGVEIADSGHVCINDS